MRTRVYRNFTFKSYAAEEPTVLMDRSDNFFTVESRITAILKDAIENGDGPMEYLIKQESKDGAVNRWIEKVYTRANDDTIYIDMIPESTEEENK